MNKQLVNTMLQSEDFQQLIDEAAPHRLKKRAAKPIVTDKTKKVVTCRTCGAYKIEKCTCSDCVNSFTNPFDELFCHLHNSTEKLCKDFKKREGITKN